MELKIIHTADIHFDTAFSGLTDTEKAAVRRQDLRTTFSKIIALSQNADMLLISGDLFDGNNVSRTTLDFLKHAFSQIRHVKVFICAGNHDCLDDNSVYKHFDFGENVYVFGTEPEMIETEHVDVYGVSFKSANDARELLPEFTIKNPQKVNILVMHGNLSGSDYNPVKLRDIENCGMDYVALGHIHAGSGLKNAGTVYYAYPGCPEGRGFDETGEKGVLALTLAKGYTKADFVPTQQRMYIEEKIDVTEAENVEDIISMVLSKCTEETHIYRIKLCGTCSFPISPAVIQNSVRAFDITVLDETGAAAKLDEISTAFTLKGLFTKFALEEREALDEDVFKLAFKTGFSMIEKEERNEN